MNEAQTLGAVTFLRQESFLSPVECDEIIDSFRYLVANPPSCAGCGSGLRSQPNRTEIEGRLWGRGQLKSMSNRLGAIRQGALEELQSFFGEAGLHVEFTLLTEMRQGDAHPLHADNERRAEDGRWIPNHTPWRAFASMVYLNTSGVDYTGGVLRFPSLGKEVVPQAGDLVGFGCGHEHEHEVTPIADGRRYSISIWLTRDPKRAERWK